MQLADGAATVGPEVVLSFAAAAEHEPVILQALRVRAVETALLDLFVKGKLHGTIHTCVGQEFTGVMVGTHLQPDDFITSNHRCHGHFIAATGNWRGLIDEIIGNADGVCAGIGSSQHLYARNFMSNGPQAALLPAAAGIALDRKHRKTNGVAISFIGEGTLGEGALYETMNLASLWGLPHLIVCENNYYSQSTPQAFSVSGDIAARAAAFGWSVRKTSTWEPAELDRAVNEALGEIRRTSRPGFLVIQTYRLNPHSKGDDSRSEEELDWFRERDPLNVILSHHNNYRARYEDMRREIDEHIDVGLTKSRLSASRYFIDQLPRATEGHWTRVDPPAHDTRFVQQYNDFYGDYLRDNERVWLIGEDIADPYGGAFKVSKGLQTKFPERVLTTPISEAAITGVGVGLAVAGNRPLVEIMFGDFMTLTVDQIVNNAAKIFHMYNQNVSCPVVVRTPMGGRRGYGPTHSQSLERLFLGIDNCLVLSPNSLVDLRRQLGGIKQIKSPAIVFENKVDYTMRPFKVPEYFVVEIDDAEFPTIILRPERVEPTVTLVSYGGMARLVADSLLQIFEETDLVPELIVPTALHPIDIAPIRRSAERTRLVVAIEGGPGFGSVSAEILAQVSEGASAHIRTGRVGAHSVPVPSVPELEDIALPSIGRICEHLRNLRQAVQ
ncbi:MAG TPA: thiamine pyrophosphate-dependent enzyme [Stellaceae bacterium]|nr:thiamine pyrophosphate-dependent enzyme [Stellaceae bacterium]